jgi:hypothetical protein
LNGRLRSIEAVGIGAYEVCFEFDGAVSSSYVFVVDERDDIAVVVRPGNFLDAVGPGGAAASQPVMEAILAFHKARQSALEFQRAD